MFYCNIIFGQFLVKKNKCRSQIFELLKMNMAYRHWFEKNTGNLSIFVSLWGWSSLNKAEEKKPPNFKVFLERYKYLGTRFILTHGQESTFWSLKKIFYIWNKLKFLDFWKIEIQFLEKRESHQIHKHVGFKWVNLTSREELYFDWDPIIRDKMFFENAEAKYKKFSKPLLDDMPTFFPVNLICKLFLYLENS